MIIPPPTYNEPDEIEPIVIDSDEARYRWIRWYIDCPNWTCFCGGVMMGRMKYCIHCKVKHGRHTPRPASYIESTYSDA